MTRFVAAAALVLAMAAGLAACQQTNTGRMSSAGAQPRTGGLSPADQTFMMEAAAGGMYEVQSSQLALRKSGDAGVKTLAQRMVDDHTRANNQLNDIARRHGSELRPTLTGDQEKMMARLNSLQGTDFDREFMSQQQQAHRDTIDKFQKQASTGMNQDLRTFATRTLPTLQMHLQMLTGESRGSNMGMER